jgi:hypothetical protein
MAGDQVLAFGYWSLKKKNQYYRIRHPNNKRQRPIAKDKQPTVSLMSISHPPLPFIKSIFSDWLTL